MAIGSILRPGRAGWLRRLHRARGGNVAMIFALTAGALVVATGAGVDMTRGVDVHSELQSIADAAALAGAAAYTSSGAASSAQTVATNYMNDAIATLPPNGGVQFTVTTGTLSSGGSTTGYTVSVTASTSMSTSLLAMVTGSVPVAVTSVAENPVVSFTADFSGWFSSAYDSNTVYYYLLPSNGSLPSSTALHKLYSNTSSSSTATTVTVTASQKVGFALGNVTGGRIGYGTNGYGAAQGSTHMFYSQLWPPSRQAYPSGQWFSGANNGPPNNFATYPSTDCSLQVFADPQKTYTNTPPVQGQCLSTPSAYMTPSCSQLNGQIMRYAWNDMGGGTDDQDYNDSMYDFYCGGMGGGGSGSGPTSVVLIK